MFVRFGLHIHTHSKPYVVCVCLHLKISYLSCCAPRRHKTTHKTEREREEGAREGDEHKNQTEEEAAAEEKPKPANHKPAAGLPPPAPALFHFPLDSLFCPCSAPALPLLLSQLLWPASKVLRAVAKTLSQFLNAAGYARLILRAQWQGF